MDIFGLAEVKAEGAEAPMPIGEPLTAKERLDLAKAHIDEILVRYNLMIHVDESYNALLLDFDSDDYVSLEEWEEE